MRLDKFATLIQPQPEPAPKPRPKSPARKALEHHVTGAIERGEAEPIKEVPVSDIMPPVTLSDATLTKDSDTQDVAQWAATHTTARVEIIGSWVWLTYPGKPSDEERARLKANGFRWANKRKQWAHDCNSKRGGRGLKVHPRTKYGSTIVKDREDD